MNLFTYGRATTATALTMRHADPAFEDWWQPYNEMMAKDPLMKYFNATRSQILKEGQLPVSNYTKMVNWDSAMIQQINQYAPPNTVTTFFGDQLGGNGWAVKMPDGSVERVYFDLPAGAGVESGLMFSDPPTQHDGVPIEDTSIANIGRLYIDTLNKIVTKFTERFST